MAVVLDTSLCLPERRLAVWQDIVCDTFVGLDCKSDMSGAFWGAVSQSRIGSVAFTQVDSTAQRVFRTPSRIARASEDFVLVTLGTSGVNANGVATPANTFNNVFMLRSLSTLLFDRL